VAPTGTASPRDGRGSTQRLGRWGWIADGILALVVAATALGFTLRSRYHVVEAVRTDAPGLPGIVAELPQDVHPNVVGPAQLILALMTGLPLVVRRRYPLTAFCVVLLAALALHLGVHDPDTALITFSACLIAAYSAIVYSPHRVGAIAAVALGAVALGFRHATNVPDITTGYLPFVLVLGVGLVANTVHRWRARFVALQSERQQATARAVADERARIARELHDVVTHNVTVMLVQAGAARMTVDAHPEQARQALLEVESAGRAALTEMRHLMGLLNPSIDPATPAGPAVQTADHRAGHDLADRDLAPQPGVDQLPDLARQVTAAGVPVELVVTGTRSPLLPGTDLTIYRIVQEALTNVVRHAPGAKVRVVLDVGADAVEVDVVDTGGPPNRLRTNDNGSGTGKGLIGMGERLALYGGNLQAGPEPTGGYRVHATIPTSA